MSIKINNKALQKAQINGKEVQKIVINGNTVWSASVPIEYIGYQFGKNGTTSTTQVNTSTITFNQANGNSGNLLNNSQDALILCGSTSYLATNITANTSGINITDVISGTSYIKKVSGFQNDGSTDYSQKYNVTISNTAMIKSFGGELIAFNKINKIVIKNNLVEAYKSNGYSASSYTYNVKQGELLVILGRINANSSSTHNVSVTNGTVLKQAAIPAYSYQGSTSSGIQAYDQVLVVQGNGSNITINVPARQSSNLHMMVLS